MAGIAVVNVTSRLRFGKISDAYSFKCFGAPEFRNLALLAPDMEPAEMRGAGNDTMRARQKRAEYELHPPDRIYSYLVGEY